jgi:hypothetical protein
MECKMKKILLILALILLPVWAWGSEPIQKDDEPIQIALLLMGETNRSYSAGSGTTWFVLMPSSTDYVLMPSSTDKVKKPGH